MTVYPAQESEKVVSNELWELAEYLTSWEQVIKILKDERIKIRKFKVLL